MPSGPPDPESRSPAPSANGNRANQIGAAQGTNEGRNTSAACHVQAIEVGSFQISTREVVRADLRTKNGRELLDIRLSTFSGGMAFPTTSGLTVPVEKIPELIELAQSALKRVRKRGMLRGFSPGLAQPSWPKSFREAAQ